MSPPSAPFPPKHTFIQQLLEAELRAPWIAPGWLKDLLGLYRMLQTPGQIDAERCKQWVMSNLPASTGSKVDERLGLEPHVNTLLRMQCPRRDLDLALIDSVRQRITKAKE